MPRVQHIDIGEKFSQFLGPRHEADGPYSGEQFRKQFLEPAVATNDRVVVHLDSVKGYTASFLEEAFGGLVRASGAGVLDKIQFVAVSRAYLIDQIEEWMRDAAARLGPSAG